MKRGFTIKLAALTAGAALIMTGCGSADQGDDNSADGTVELTFHTWLPTQVQWPEIIEAFEAENPGK